MEGGTIRSSSYLRFTAWCACWRRFGSRAPRGDGAAPGAVRAYPGVPDAKAAGANNTRALNAALAALHPGDTLLIPNKTYYLAGGVRADGLHNVTVQLDGTLSFLPGRAGWPTRPADKCDVIPLQPKRNKSCVQECIFITGSWA